LPPEFGIFSLPAIEGDTLQPWASNAINAFVCLLKISRRGMAKQPVCGGERPFLATLAAFLGVTRLKGKPLARAVPFAAISEWLMEYLSLVMRWMHVLAAIALMGGTIFMRFGLHPSLAALGEEQQKALKAAVRARWSKWVMGASGFLLVSGIVNIVLFSQRYKLDPLYHPLIGVKMLLGLAIMFFASMLVGRTANAEKFREKAVMWLNINLLLATIVVCLGGYCGLVRSHSKLKGETPAAKVDVVEP
jgi:uncharacterized membrane protein